MTNEKTDLQKRLDAIFQVETPEYNDNDIHNILKEEREYFENHFKCIDENLIFTDEQRINNKHPID